MTTEPSNYVICRVCTVPTKPEATSNMFESTVADGYSLAQVAALIGAIEVRREEDGLPEWCCFQCQLDVEMAYRVRVLCRESDRKLREQLEAIVLVDLVKETDDEGLFIAEEDESWTMVEQTELQNTDEFEEIPAIKVRCCGCRQLFDNEQDLLVHGRREHAVGVPPKDTKREKFCHVCCRLINRTRFLSHKRMPQTLFRCKDCGELLLSKTQVSVHQLTVHFKSGKCCGCKKTFQNEEALRLHSEQIHLPQRNPSNEESLFECNICYRNFRDSSKFYQHRVRSQKRYRCSKCGKSFKVRNALQRHQLSHKNPTTYRCKLCSKVFDNDAKYRRHIRRHQVPEARFECEPCGLAFKYRYSLSDHNVSHHGATVLRTYARVVLSSHNGKLDPGEQHESQAENDSLLCKLEIDSSIR